MDAGAPGTSDGPTAVEVHSFARGGGLRDDLLAAAIFRYQLHNSALRLQALDGVFIDLDWSPRTLFRRRRTM